MYAHKHGLSLGLAGQGAPQSDSYDALDTAIASLTAQLVSLKSRRNALAPVSRMPPELFSRCFTLVVNSCEDKVEGAYELNSIAHVCRHWRKVALADHALWSSSDYTVPDLAHTMLLRAGGSALSLAFPLGMEGIDDVAKSALMAKRTQIQSLQISASRSSLAADFMPIIEGAASRLLCLQYSDTDAYNSRADPSHPLSSVLTPNLRELRLINFFPPHKLPQVYANLTCLSIQNNCTVIEPSLLLRLPSLLGMLAQMPVLANLTVHQTRHMNFHWNTPLEESEPLNPDLLVSMPALRSLSINDALHTALGPALLRAIHAPHLQHVYCAWANASELWSSRELIKWWEAWSSRPLLSLAVDVKQWNRVRWPPSDSRCSVGLKYSLQRGTSLVKHALERHDPATAPYTYPLTLSVRARAATPMTEIIPQVLLTKTTSLEITVTGDYTPPQPNLALFGIRSRTWAESAPWEALAASRCLVELALDTDPCWSLLYFSKHLAPSTAPNALFPALRTVKLIGADFNPENRFLDTFDVYDEGNEGASILEPFTAWLIVRKTSGVPVEKLVFDRCIWWSQTPSMGLRDAVSSLLVTDST